jgi:hypothetical protein
MTTYLMDRTFKGKQAVFVRTLRCGLSVTALLLLGGCESIIAPPLQKERLGTMKTVAVVSLLTDQVSGSRPEGVKQAFPPATLVEWRTNEAIRTLAADVLRGRGLTFVDVPYQPPEPSPATVQQHEDMMVQVMARAVTRLADTAPVDLVLVIHPADLNRYGYTRSLSAAGAFLTLSIRGAISAATDEYRPGYLMLQTFGTPHSCLIGYRLYFIDTHTEEILSQTQDMVARASLDREIWPPDYPSLPLTDRKALQTGCLSGLGRSVVDHVSSMTGAR